jgi:hypothetical protein
MGTDLTDFSGLAEGKALGNPYPEIQSPNEATQNGKLQSNEPGLRRFGSYTPPEVKWPK